MVYFHVNIAATHITEDKDDIKTSGSRSKGIHSMTRRSNIMGKPNSII